MKKRLMTVIMAGLMTAAMGTAGFAGEWKQDQVGSWYQNDDGSYVKDGWSWIDGRRYYFTPEGYCLKNTTTPDGFTVDENGAWIVDGVIQTQDGASVQDHAAALDEGGQNSDGGAIGTEAATASELEAVSQTYGTQFAVNGLVFIIPSGFIKDETIDEISLYFYNSSRDGAIAVRSEVIPSAEQTGTSLEKYSEGILDKAMNQIGTPVAKVEKQFPTGKWYCYQYDSAEDYGVRGGVFAYGRISGTRIQMVMFMGNITGDSPDEIMMNNLR